MSNDANARSPGRSLTGALIGWYQPWGPEVPAIPIAISARSVLRPSARSRDYLVKRKSALRSVPSFNLTISCRHPVQPFSVFQT